MITITNLSFFFVSGKHLIFKSKDVNDLADKVVKIAGREWNEIPLKRFEWDESITKYLDIYGELVT